MTPAEIRKARAANHRARARDFADSHGLAEAALVAAFTGKGVVAVEAGPERLLPPVRQLGESLALTRNASAVQEREGRYGPLAPLGEGWTLTGDGIELQIDPRHWVHAFAVTEETAKGAKRSIQVFDAAGEAVHKIHLTATSDVAAFGRLIEELRLAKQSDTLPLVPAGPAAPSGSPADAGLTQLWDESPSPEALGPRLAAAGISPPDVLKELGAPRARPLRPVAMTELLERAAAGGVPLEIRGGNPGCLQIFRGRVERILPAGYWINVMDPGYNLHLRTDHLASVYLTDRGPAGGLTVEAYDAAGSLILAVTGEAGWDQVAQGLSAVP
ncbi:ChuX/HutX family heme-like substrate-binding protein [Cereibacter azotoformans]|uniref:ChuX/HutX family heme-like substrate-binding protein n=1 Tax=Cereibacter azotoformans TaxID=43057 RepID=UPI003B21811C